MTKQEYVKPAIEVIKADTEAQILAGSLTGVFTDLGSDELTLPTGDDPITGSLLDDAL